LDLGRRGRARRRRRKFLPEGTVPGHYWRFIHIPIATLAISPTSRNAPKQMSAVTSGLIAFFSSANHHTLNSLA
jgi:hypothetical protein